MKQLLMPILALFIFALLTSTTVLAEERQKMIIALSTSDFELAETDVSSLAVGESKTIETESGSVIDILRTNDGAEIYIDGELLEIDGDHEGLHEAHQFTKHVEVICEDEENCKKDVMVVTGGGADFSELLTEEGGDVIFHKDIRLSCKNDEDGTSCSDENVWVSEDGDIDIEELHHLQGGEKGHKVIVIKKETLAED